MPEVLPHECYCIIVIVVYCVMLCKQCMYICFHSQWSILMFSFNGLDYSNEL